MNSVVSRENGRKTGGISIAWKAYFGLPMHLLSYAEPLLQSNLQRFHISFFMHRERLWPHDDAGKLLLQVHVIPRPALPD
jgi:hypothetical protein